MRFIPLLVLGLLFVEIWSIIKVGHEIGALATLILLVAGFIFGKQLLRLQGLASMMKTAQTLQSGESPLEPMALGVIKALAGILLIFPGFISDIIALVLLLPFVQKALVKRLLKQSQFQGFAAGNFSQSGFGQGSFGRGFGGFGNAAANEAGNVYEHEGSARTSEDRSNVIEHQDTKK